jgi:hypothetical protein
MISRRGFLQVSSAAAVSILPIFHNPFLFPPDDGTDSPVGRARVAARLVYRYTEASLRSPRTGTIRRDEIVNIYEEIISPDGPIRNPRWYRLSEGFVHSAHLQRVDGAHPSQNPLQAIPKSGQLGEVCVPYTQSYRKPATEDWTKLYRLYYQSVHWITGIEIASNGNVWYRITDELLHVHHYVPAIHIQPVYSNELSPISPDVPEGEKHILVSRADQSLTAYEGNQPVLQAKVSTGVPGDPPPGLLPTETPAGRFHVQTKMPSRHMGDGTLTDDPEAYELPGVPWVCFFTKDGIAFHGTYWHDNFGSRMSSGCVNLRSADARWLYRWTTPAIYAGEWYTRGMGTLVEIL